MRAVCRISAAGRQRVPDTPARRGPARLESSRAPGARTERASTVSDRVSRDRWARAVCICPRPRGGCDAHSRGGRAPVPLHRAAILQEPVVFGDWFVNLNAPTDWFSPRKRRGTYKPRAAGFAASGVWGWWCKPVMISRILPTHSVITSEDIRCVFGNLGSARASRPEGFSQKSRSAVFTLQVRCALLSAWRQI